MKLQGYEKDAPEYVVQSTYNDGCYCAYDARGLEDAAYIAANNARWERDAKHKVVMTWPMPHPDGICGVAWHSRTIWDAASYTD